jgi:hypothetical protein
MSDTVDWDTGGPRCPKHGVVLIRTGDPGIGICPVSDARFSYDADYAEKTRKLRLNALGQYEYEADWKVHKIDGDDD